MALGVMHVYANGMLHFTQGGINLATPDTLKCTLHTASYTPNYATDAHQSNLTNEVGAGNGYTTGGNTLTGVSVSLVVANSLAAWVTATAYNVGDVVRPTAGNTHVYMCMVAGTSGSEPSWPTSPGGTVNDNGITWAEVGQAVVKVLGSVPAWTATGAGFTCRYGVIADTTPGSAATNPLMCCIDFQSDQTPSGGGTFTITLDALGMMVIPIRY